MKKIILLFSLVSSVVLAQGNLTNSANPSTLTNPSDPTNLSTPGNPGTLSNPTNPAPADLRDGPNDGHIQREEDKMLNPSNGRDLENDGDGMDDDDLENNY